MDSLHTKLAKATSEFKKIVKNCTNPHYKNRYADLTAIIEATQPALSKYGVVVSQIIGDNKLITIISDGIDEIRSEFPLQMDSNIQKFGSYLTYARRYSLSAILNVGSEDDEDGEIATSQPTKTQTYDKNNKNHKQVLISVLTRLNIDVNQNKNDAVKVNENLHGTDLSLVESKTKELLEKIGAGEL